MLKSDDTGKEAVVKRVVAAAAGFLVVVALAAAYGSRPTAAVARTDTSLPRGQSQALGLTLRDLPSLRIAGRVGRPPPDVRRPRAAWVYYKMRVSSAPDYVRAHWQGWLASAVLRDASRNRRWPPVLGHRFTLARANGSQRLDSESALGQAFRGRIERASETELRKLLEESSRTAQVKLVAIRFARPLGRLAPEITVETSDPRRFLQNVAGNVWKIVAPINGGAGRPRAEGTFVYVRSPKRLWVAVFGYAVRTSSGTSATNPRFR